MTAPRPARRPPPAPVGLQDLPAAVAAYDLADLGPLLDAIARREARRHRAADSPHVLKG